MKPTCASFLFWEEVEDSREETRTADANFGSTAFLCTAGRYEPLAVAGFGPTFRLGRCILDQISRATHGTRGAGDVKGYKVSRSHHALGLLVAAGSCSLNASILGRSACAPPTESRGNS